MRTHEYEAKKGYEGTALYGQTLTWSVPQTMAEALGPNPDRPDGQPFFLSENDVVALAVAQLNIKKGHAVAALVGEDVKDEKRITTVEAANALARGVVHRPRGEGTGTRKPSKGLGRKQSEAVKAATADLSDKEPAELRTLVKFHVITQEAYDAEMARRKGAGKGSK